MTKRDWRTDVRLTSDTSAELPDTQERRGEDEEFIIAVLGDFRASEEGAPALQSGPLSGRKFLEIDRDNFDATLAGLNVQWQGKLEGVPGQSDSGVEVRLEIRELDDFLPDRIARRVLPLRLLLETRRALDDPARFAAVSAEVARWAGPPGTTGQESPRSRPVEVDSSGLLSLIVEKRDEEIRLKPSDPWSSELEHFVRRAVEPHLIRIDTKRQDRLTQAVDRALSEQVRSIMHSRPFRDLEAAWRSLHWLVHSAETGTSLKVRMLQASREDLVQDMMSHTEMGESGLARLLLVPASVPGGEGVSLMLGNYEFSNDLEDLALLERIGNVAHGLRAPFVAAASPALFGCRSFDEMPGPRMLESRFQEPDYRPWHVLRRSAAGRWLALAVPHLLMRLPYGSKTEPAEEFAFEEAIGADEHGKLLWGNPAFAVGVAVAGAFAESGWEMDPARGVVRLEGLPLYVFEADGETVTKPCAEILFHEQLLEWLEEAGFIPLVSYRDRDMVTLPCLQVLATPRAPLSWIG